MQWRGTRSQYIAIHRMMQLYMDVKSEMVIVV